MTDGMKEEVASGDKHVLLELAPTVFESFDEWLARWEKTDILAEKLGLLHSLTIENGWWGQNPKLISFLLKLADGHNRESNFRVHGEHDNYSRKAKNRQSIAEKAFAVLCLQFFKGKARNYDRHPWWWMFENESLFQKVLWFLRLSSDYGCLHNPCDSNDRNHHQEAYRAFLEEFARLGWEFCDLSVRSLGSMDEAIKKRLIAARPQFIEILAELGNLRWLNSQELDPACLKRLIELAMRRHYHFPPSFVDESTYREAVSLEEAVLGGSVAAQVVLLYRIRQRESERISAQFQESERRQEEEDRQRELMRIEEEKRLLDKRAQELQK